MVRDMLNPTPSGSATVPDPDVRAFVAAFYVVAIAFLVYPLTDLAFTLVPLSLNSVQWRFGAVGFTGQTMWSQVAGVAIAALVAFWLNHRAVLRVVGIYGLLVAAVMVVLLVMASLDFLQLRKSVGYTIRPKFDAAGLRLVVQCALSCPLLGWFGWSALRVGRSPSSSRNRGDQLGVVYGVGVKQSSRGAS